jgi:hypothetical protein
MLFLILYYALVYLLLFALPGLIFLFANRIKAISFFVGSICLLFAGYMFYLISISPGDSPGGSFGLGIVYMIFFIAMANGLAFIAGGLRKRKIIFGSK